MGLTGKVQTAIEQVAAESGTAVSGESKINFTTDDGLQATVSTNAVTKEQTVNHTLSAHIIRHITGGSDPFTSAQTIEAQAKRILETSGPTALDFAGITDGQYLKRNGATIDSGTPTDTNYYDATFIVGSTSNCTHTTLASAVAAITGSTLIKLTAETHTLAGKVTIDCTNRNITIDGYGATLTLADGVNDNAFDITSSTNTGRFIGRGFVLNGNKANQTGGNGIYSYSNLNLFVLEDIYVYNAYANGFHIISQLSPYAYNLDRCYSISCGSNGFYLNGHNIVATDIYSYGNGIDGVALLYPSHTILTNPVCVSNTGYGISFNTTTSTESFILNNPICVSNSGYGIGNRSGFEPVYAEINGGNISSNGNSGIYCEFTSVNGVTVKSNTGCGIYAYYASITGCDVQSNTQNGIILNSYQRVTGNRLFGNGAGAYAAIRIIGTLNIIADNLIHGATHTYGIEEDVGADYTTIEGNTISTPATGDYLIRGANSCVNDPCLVSGTITRAAGQGNGTSTVSSLGTGSCPKNIEILASYDNDCTVFSHGGYAASGMEAAHYAMGASAGQAIKDFTVVQVQSAIGDGHHGRITAIGASGGSEQDTFTITWTKIGNGAATTARYRAWR